MSPATEQRQVRGAATVFSDYASVLGARAAAALLSLVSVLVVTRILGPDGYGLVAYVSVIALLIVTITSAWTSTAVSRYGREEFEVEGSTLAVTWSRLQLTAPLLGISALIVVSIKLAGGFPPQLSWGLTWLAILLGFALVVSEHIVYSLEAMGRMKASAAQLVTRQLVVLAGLAAILVLGFDQSPEVVALVLVAAAGLSAFVFGSSIRRISLWPPTSNPRLRRQMLRFSVPLIAFTLSQYAIRSVDLIVIGAFAGAATVGVYAVAYQAYGVLQQLTTTSGPVLTPLFVSLRMAEREELVDRYVARAIPQLTLIAATLMGTSVALVGILVPAVFGGSFAGASDPLAVLLLATALGFVANLLSPVIVLHERTSAVGAVNVVAAVINIVGDVVLVGPAGLHLVGPAIATSVAMATIVIGYVLIVRDCTSAHVAFPLTPLLPFFAGAIPAMTLNDALAVPVAIVATALCAAMILLFARPFDRNDLDLISRLDIPRPLKRLTARTLELTAR
jgi:O-antigen/teichoic acid export membrane protein